VKDDTLTLKGNSEMMICTLPIGTTVRLPYSGTVVTIERHGDMGTVVRKASTRQRFTAKVSETKVLTTKTVTFTAKGARSIVASSTEVEVN
jgi:hypothetical protein